MIAVLMSGYLLHSEGVMWRHSAMYSQYQCQINLKPLDVIVTVRAVEKSFAPAGTRTPVPRLSTILSI
jgi:hypothetical protein